MMINEIEQQSQDIDWYFTNGEEIAFVASGGGRLPRSIAQSREDLEVLQNYFFDIEETTNAIVNSDLEKLLPDGNVNMEYLEDFIWRAKNGLFVYDNTFPGEWSNTNITS